MATNIKEIENKLWESANALRGNLSAEEYMHVVLGVLSLKYISDRYKKAMEKLKADGFSSIEQVGGIDDFYHNYGNAFLVNKVASWDYISNYTNFPVIGEKLDDAFIQLEKDNPMLRGIFNKNYNREGLDQTRLGEVVRTFSNEDFSADSQEDLIGRIYEFFLGKFFKDRGQKGGEFYTPDSIVKLMVHILKPLKGTIYDPACGTGGILVQSKRYIEENKGDTRQITVYGQEFNNTTWKLAKLNLILNGFGLEDASDDKVLGERSADTFTQDQHRNQLFDFVMANPPFNIKQWGYDQLLDDPRWKWGVPPKGNANYAWISHMISKLNSTGQAAVVLANGSLSSSQKDEVAIRKALVENNLIEAIVELPDKLFYTTGIPACVWFFNKNKQMQDVLMVANTVVKGNMIDKKLRELTDNDIQTITSLVERHQSGEEVEELGKAKCITKREIAENDYSFVPGRYVGSAQEKVDKEVINAEIEILGKELFKLLDQFNDLVPDVKRVINELLEKEDK